MKKSNFFYLFFVLSLLLTVGTSEVSAITVTVTVYDSQGNPLEGVPVTYKGAFYVSFGTTDAGGVATNDLPSGTYTFKATYQNTLAEQTQDIGANPSLIFYTSQSKAVVKDCSNNPISGIGIRFYGTGYPGAFVSVNTDGSGSATTELFPGNWKIDARINDTEEEKTYMLAGDGTTSGQTTTTTFAPATVSFPGINPVHYWKGYWASFTSPGYMFPATVKFRFGGVGGPEADVTISGCALTGVMLKVLDENGNGVAGGTATPANGGVWLPAFPGTTDANGNLFALLPASFTKIRMEVNQGSQEQTLAQLNTSNYTWYTEILRIWLKNHTGAAITDGNGLLEQGGGFWYNWGNFNASGYRDIQLFARPGAYTFKTTYNYTSQVKNPVVNAGAGIQNYDFQTGQVYGNCITQYSTGAWRTFTDGMELLPGTYLFRYPSSPGTIVAGEITYLTNCNLEFSGKIEWSDDQSMGVNNTTVNLTGSGTANDLSDVNGNYLISIPNATGNFTLTPVKNINKLNGITTADATAIQQHLTSIALLPAPFKRIAADVNKSNSISTLDATLINQVLLGNPSANAIFNTSWRFVPASYTFPNPNAPWGFPEKITLTSVSGNVSGQDFKGIKLGDVVSAWANPANFGAGEPLVLRVQDRVLQAGSEVTAEFRADQLNDLNAFQFALHFDPEQLQLVKIEPMTGLPVSMDNFGAYNVAEGEIRMVWSQPTSVLLSEAVPVFRLQFKALESGMRLSEVLQLNEEALSGHVYNSAYEESGVELKYSALTGQTDIENSGALMLKNQPNPFAEVTTLRFVLPEADEAELRISDVAGRLLFSQKKYYAAGRQEETLRLPGITGVLFVKLTTEQGSMVHKMLAVKNR